jgi:hypothetical protein
MSYKFFIDDERFPVTHGFPSFISFDHDLGGEDTSIVFINWLTDQLIDGYLAIPSDFDYYVHSQNPIGVDNIKSKMDQLIRHFKNS